MFQALLVRRYMLSKIMPLLAALAVLLCTAMVLVTWSVMGGFLDMLIRSGRTMTGDVVIAWPNVGFAQYEELVRDLEKDPSIEAAAPVIETYALLGLPNKRQEMVFLRGIAPESYSRVTAYRELVWWKPLDEPISKDSARRDPRLDPSIRQDLEQYHANGLALARIDRNGQAKPAVVMGIEVSGFNYREAEGFYSPSQFAIRSSEGSRVVVDSFMPRDGSVVLSVLPLDEKGRVVQQLSIELPVANEFQSGLYEADSKVVFAPLATIQSLLGLGEATRVASGGSGVVTDEQGNESFGSATVLGKVPARVTHVLVRGKGDLGRLGAADALRLRVQDIYGAFARRHPGKVPGEFEISILTWEDQNRTMINAVQSETGLVLFLFTMISFVAVFLVLAIFWSMIAEKTKDIGVLRSLGASRTGVAGVWIGYGLILGLVGALLGVAVAILIVRNINSIHDWMGSALGISIWKPQIYYFTIIPSKVVPMNAAIVLMGGVLSSVLGAIIPAWRAARMDPVRALRFE